MRKYKYTYEFKESEEEAKAFCDNENSKGSIYKRKHKKAVYTAYKTLFCCWYWY